MLRRHPRRQPPFLDAYAVGVEGSQYRVSDAERDHAVVALRGHLLAGRLTLEEFSERVEVALRASVRRELAEVQRDLPRFPSQPTGARRPTRFTGAVFAHVVRRGRLRLRRRTRVVSVFSDVDFDLREATVERPRTTVALTTFFGNVDVYLPEALNVEVGGLAVFGHRRDWGADVAPLDAPTVRVRVLGLFGTVDVWRVPADVRGDYGDVARQIKRRSRKGRLDRARAGELSS
jgi:hypothetical protein